MNKLRHIRKDFVRQVSENDCGIACLGMILNYTGRGSEISIMRSHINTTNELSMLELKKIAEQFKIAAQCVEMDIEYLRNITLPCILHTKTITGQYHYQVCYGAFKKQGKYKFLMADPARQVYIMEEEQLEDVWQSKAAVYFNILKKDSDLKLPNPWVALLSTNYFPKGLFLSIPFLNLCSVSLGIAISWVLQKGINDSLAYKKNSLIVGIILLLLIITISRSLFSYIKQRILIILNNSVNERLVKQLIINTVNKNLKLSNAGLISIKYGLAEIQKIQNALSVFVATLLSDGSLILLLVSASCYTLPLSGLILIPYLILVVFLTVRSLPQFIFDYAHLNQLSGITENYLAKETQLDADSVEIMANRIRFHEDNHKRYLKFARSIAYRISRMNLLYECLGTISVISNLCLSLIGLQHQEISYGTFMVLVILSYLVTSLMPKIANSLFVIAEGAEAYVLFKSNMPDEIDL
ncbi:MAG: hypothetical protein NVSMB24_27470 [Mucilaginibacter sp.]